MAKTIKAMAQARKMGLFLNGADIPEIYEQGAMDVLREVEDIAYRRYSDDDGGVSRNRDLIRLIKELKGE